MKSVVRIEGLDCPNCARSLANAINKLEGVKNAEIDFVNSKLSFEAGDADFAISQIISLTKQLEPNVKIILDKKKTNLINKTFIIDLLTIIVGTVIGICALFIPMSNTLFWILFIISALILGYKTYYKAIILLFKGTINENLLITLSVIGATAIGEHREGLMVIWLYSIGKLLEGLAVNKSRKSIENLTNLQPEYANILIDGKEEKVSPDQVKVGSTIIVRAGERVPLDGKVLNGKASLNTQSLTGESLPVFVNINDKILSGSIVLDGVLTIQTCEEYENSTVNKIINLIENAQEKKSKTETVISKITKWYTLGVLLISVLVFGIVYLVTNEFTTALYRGMIFLVVSCPCAFAISVPLSYFSGLGNASKNGILIKGSNYLDALSKLNILAFDKTGTITTGEFSVENIEIKDKQKSREDVIYLASLGEQNSIHPLAKSILALNNKKLEKVDDVNEVAGEGVYYTYQNKKYFIGRKNKENKSTIVELYENDNLISIFYLSDTIKHSAKQTIKDLKALNIKTCLLSGDNKETVEKVGAELGVDEVKYQLLPQDKFKWIDNLKKTNKVQIGYVGDGINDAPSLTRADVGISMGINGSPASIEASDVVLVDDNPDKAATAIKISKYTRKIVWQNITLSAVVKVLFLSLGAFGITGMLSAVFADVGVTLIAILNSLRALKYNPNKLLK